MKYKAGKVRGSQSAATEIRFHDDDEPMTAESPVPERRKLLNRTSDYDVAMHKLAEVNMFLRFVHQWALTPG